MARIKLTYSSQLWGIVKVTKTNFHPDTWDLVLKLLPKCDLNDFNNKLISYFLLSVENFLNKGQ